METHHELVIDYADVDRNNPPVWASAVRAHLTGAILRADYSIWPDADPARDRVAIRTAGLKYGAYGMPDYRKEAASPRQQMRVFASGAQLLPGIDMPGTLDIEYGRGIAATHMSREENAAFLGECVDELRIIFGIDPMKYCSQRVLDTFDTDTLAGAANAVLAGLPNWIARYIGGARQEAQIDPATIDATPAPPIPACDGGASDPGNWWFRQRQGDAIHFPGFSSTIDVDVFNPMAIGEHGRRVKWVQIRIGLTGSDVDGAFGPQTQGKLKAFQDAHKLPSTGAVDLATFCALAWVKTYGNDGKPIRLA